MGNVLNPSSPGFSLVLMVMLIAMLYFMMIRPQKKREKAEQEMRAALRVGDEVITIGGIVGKVEKIGDKTVVISTTAGKNKIEFLKTSIASVSKGTQSAASAPKETPKPVEEEKSPNRDKKVTPKKLSKKSEDDKAE
jgi:preprotein translocase subunit YajC